MPGGELLSPDIDAYLLEQERKDLLRFLTAGSVDDGKSTLIGRLLFDTQMIYEDQLAALRADSLRRSSNTDALDLALLMDGLKAEREQGITIDVAYRYCSTSRRKFIIADCPGHEQYTRNMVTGASNCDLAIILVDARNGVVRQTKRHSFIVSLLGLKHVVVAINKMDLVDYSHEVFERHVREYAEFSARLDIPDLRFIPISALKGDNVVEPSWHMPWYRGETLLHSLETVHIGSDRNLIDLRFPVQYVNRANGSCRGFSGTVASGVLRKGDEVAVLPSGCRTRVKSIATYDGDLQEAFPPMAVTVTLTDELDISRGDMLVHPANLPRMDQTFEAMVVWMGEEPLLPGRQYWVKQTSAVVGGSVSTVRYRVDVNTLQREAASTLAMNEVGRCSVTVNRPICYDPYALNRTTGGFIFIDRSTNRTVGAGIIVDRRTSLPFLRDPDAESRPPSAEPVRTRVSDRERRARFGQSAATVVLTGSSPARVVEIAYALERHLFDAGHAVCVIDAEQPGTLRERDSAGAGGIERKNLQRALEIARSMNGAGLICIAPLSTLSAAVRDATATSIRSEHFVEVHVLGADSPQPASFHKNELRPDLGLQTDESNVDECVAQIVALLRSRGMIG